MEPLMSVGLCWRFLEQRMDYCKYAVIITHVAASSSNVRAAD